jgi:hypothetical protein
VGSAGASKAERTRSRLGDCHHDSLFIEGAKRGAAGSFRESSTRHSGPTARAAAPGGRGCLRVVFPSMAPISRFDSYFGSSSMPRLTWSVSSAAASVVPLPRKGSREPCPASFIARFNLNVYRISCAVPIIGERTCAGVQDSKNRGRNSR